MVREYRTGRGWSRWSCLRERRGRMRPAASRRSDRSGSRRRRGSVEEDWLGSLWNRASGGHQMMRQSRVRWLGHRRERGITLPRRNRAEEAACERISDEEFLGLGGVSSGRTKVRWERRPRAIYRRGLDCSNGAEWAGEITPAVTGSRGEEIAGGGRRVTWPGRRGPRASERKRKRVYRFGMARWAAGWFCYWADAFPSAFSIFLFFSSFLFPFSYFFHRFCILHPNKVKPISKFL
jgi:hypothetical protein